MVFSKMFDSFYDIFMIYISTCCDNMTRCRHHPEPDHLMRDRCKLGVGILNIYTAPVSSYSDEDILYVETLVAY